MKSIRFIALILSTVVLTVSAQTTDWESVGDITVYRDGSTSSKVIARLYKTKTDDTMYKIKTTSSNDYIVAPNPLYDPKSSYSKKCFKYVAGNYYLNLGLR